MSGIITSLFWWLLEIPWILTSLENPHYNVTYILPQSNNVDHIPSLDLDFVQATYPASDVALLHLASKCSKHPAIQLLI
jgi:hypothetical protein